MSFFFSLEEKCYLNYRPEEEIRSQEKNILIDKKKFIIFSTQFLKYSFYNINGLRKHNGKYIRVEFFNESQYFIVMIHKMSFCLFPF